MALITTLIRIVVAVVATTTLLAATPFEAADLTVRRPADRNAPRTAEQQALVDFAFQRYADHGLDLPDDVRIEFHPSEAFCNGKFGIAYSDTRSIHMCSLNERTMLHELAHIWAAEHLDDEDRDRFMNFRGLEVWRSHDVEWEHRATEHAAEFIAWGLVADPIHVPYLVTDDDGSTRTSHRLVTVPDSDIEVLLEGFEMLTGQAPRFRDASEWQVRQAARSPEALRMALTDTATSTDGPDCVAVDDTADRTLLLRAGVTACDR